MTKSANYLILFLATVLPILPVAKVVAADPTYSIGVVPQFDLRRIKSVWQPILDKLHENTGILLTLQGSSDIPEFEKQFGAGNFDFAYMNPYHLLVANKKQGYEAIVRDVGRTLYGIIVVRKDSLLKDISELNDKKIAFPSPNALGAALLPRAEFAHKSIKFEPLYVKSHTAVYLNVALGKVDAGGGVQKTLEQQKPLIRDNLRVLHKTAKVPPHPIAVHPRVPEADRNKIQQALLSLGESEEGRSLLAKIPMKTIGKAGNSDYDELKKMGLDAFYVNKKP